MKRTRILILLAVFTAALALQVLPLYAADWTPIYEGVDYCQREKTSPRLMKAFAMRIDLQNPNVSFFATPSNGGSPYETVAQTTPTFRSTYGLEAAVNANYSIIHSPNAEVDGVLVSNGSYVSYDQAYRQAQLRLTAAKVASIVGTGGNPSGFHTIVSGDAHHLVNGVALGDNSWTAPRTSVGLSQDGRFLIWCVVDGRQPGWSDGATILDMSYWMQDFGAYNAINLDGGGSSCLCSASGGVYNRPSDGSPRSVGANMGVNTVGLPPLLNPPYVFNSDTQLWTPGNSASAIEWVGPEWGWPGCIYFDQTGTDCYVFGPRTNINGTGYPQVVNVSLYPQGGNTSSHQMQMFFRTNAENWFDAAKSSPMVNYTCQNAWTAVNVNVNNSKWWNQTISQLRLDMDHSYNSGARYIVNHVVVQNQVWYDFDSSTQGWVVGNSLSTPWIWNGYLCTDQTGGDAFMYGPEISGSGYPYNYLGGANDKIHVRVYPEGGTTSSHNMQVFWITSSDGVWNEAKSTYVNFTGQNQWVDVYLPVGSNATWGQWGHIKQLRLDFDTVNTGTRWIVDYIRTEY